MIRGPLAAALVVVTLFASSLSAADDRKAGAGGAPAAASAAASAPSVMDLPAIKRVLKGGQGHAVLVHFWATWCFPCLQELPMIDKLARDLKPRGVEVLSLSLDDPDQSSARVVKVLSEAAPSLTRSIARVDDPDAFIGSFGSWEGSIPAVFGYDADGQLRGEVIGETNRRALDGLVGRVLKSKPHSAH